MKKNRKLLMHIFDGPMLDTIRVAQPPVAERNKHPFNLNIIQNLTDITFPTRVTFLVGENGTGKSTILEAIANSVGFGAEGGSKHVQFETTDENSAAQVLSAQFTLSWRLKARHGYFFRAESFFNVATYIDTVGDMQQFYGGKSLHHQSHGESFLSFFTHRLPKDGFFIFDEPEAALSPQRQLALLTIIHDLSQKSNAQFIIATHSPILLAYPNATIYSCDSGTLTETAYTDTEHYQITKDFMNDPARYLHHLLGD